MSIYDVAKKAGVSVATVSRVINESATVSQETKIKVLKAIKELDYVPNGIARSLATNKTESVGIMVSNIRNYFDHQLAYELEKNLNEYGIVSILCNTTIETKKKLDYLYLLREKKVDAIITVGSMYEEKDFFEELAKASKDFPIIMINSILDREYKNIVTVSSAEETGIMNSLSYIKSRGYKNPIYIYPVDSMENRAAISKRKAFGKAIKTYYPENDLIEFESSDVDDEIIEVIKILRDQKADAIQFENDNLAIQYYKHFLSLGVKIPEEIAIVGFDNIDSSNFTQKAISSIDQQLSLQAKIAVESLEKLMRNESVKHETIVDSVFLAKETT
jgi:DNA-binding LacI/PurR family transcriptional regulator